MRTGPVLLFRVAVLAVGEGRIGDVHAVIADLLGIGDLIVIHADLPVPVGAVDGLDRIFVEFQPPVKRVGEGAGGVPVLAVPLDRNPHRVTVGLLGCEAFAVFRTGFAAHAALGARHDGQMGVARAIGEKAPADLDPLLFGRLDGDDRTDHSLLLLDAGNGVSEEERDVLFGQDDPEFLVVLIVVRPSGVSDPVGPDLIEQVSQRGVGIDIDLAAQSDAHLRGVVSSQNVPVLYEGDAAPQTGGCEGGADSRNSAADDHEVERSLVNGCFGP